MFDIFFLLLSSLRSCLSTRAALQAEILALRHQVLILQRAARGRRLRFKVGDRVFWVWLSHLWKNWRLPLRIIRPETVIAWNRKGFRLYWIWKSRARNGRRPITRDVCTLIRKMSLANPRWGAPRIHGELLKLGIDNRGKHGGQVYGPSAQAALPNMEDISEQPYAGLGLNRLLRCSNSNIPAAVRLCCALT
jgi:hypothetical protein